MSELGYILEAKILEINIINDINLYLCGEKYMLNIIKCNIWCTFLAINRIEVLISLEDIYARID